MPVELDAAFLYIALGAAAVLCLVAWRLRRENRSLAQRAAALEDELRRISQEREYRVERFDALWFPVVSFSPSDRTVDGVRPGVPHCRACALPLVSGEGGWTCKTCGAALSADLANLSVGDLIGKEALRLFLERHKDYKESRR